MHDIFLLTQKHDLIEYFTERFPRIKAFPVKTSDRKIDREKLSEILSRTLTKYFYVIVDPNVKLENFDFDYEPAAGEEQFVHIWDNNTNIRLYNREKVLENIDNFTDDAMYQGRVNFKSHNRKIQTGTQFDVVFLSNNETFADGNFELLQERFPDAKRVNGVKGIFNAHKRASEIVDTSMVYIVDADAELTDDFDFSYVPPESDRGFAHVWRSVNPVNGLQYGYGGVKLFPTKMMRASEFWRVDFTTTFSEGLKLMPGTSNISRFNTSAFETWRSAFRECAKLASSIIDESSENHERLDVWCEQGITRAFGTYALEGAAAGREYGTANKKNVKQLNCINDYAWLKEQFDKRYTDEFRHNRSCSLYQERLASHQRRANANRTEELSQ
tara:strand:+ start:347 stop:1504 length:1158 start_codon:yes stop_codon:yes gene_type:complete